MDLVTGTMARLNRGAVTQGYVSKGRGQVNTFNTSAFMVGRTPVEYKSKTAPFMEEGDRIAVAGKRQRNGLIKAYAIKNFDSDFVQAESATTMLILGAVLFFAGILSIVVVIGILILPMAIWIFKTGLDVKKAERMVRAAKIPEA